MNNQFLTAAELGEYLDLSRSRIADLKTSKILIPDSKKKAPGKGGGGLFDRDEGRVSYIRYLRGVNAEARGKLSARVSNYSESDFDNLLREEQWRAKKRENDLAENDITAVVTVQYALMQVAKKLSSIINKIVPNIVRLWPEADEELLEVITTTVRQALVEAANINLTEAQITENED